MIKQVDKYKKVRNTISGKGQILNAKEPHKAAWELVCLPKKERELGVINLQTHNAALLLKNLYRFFNRQDIPWVHLIWDSYYNDRSIPSN